MRGHWRPGVPARAETGGPHPAGRGQARTREPRTHPRLDDARRDAVTGSARTPAQPCSGIGPPGISPRVDRGDALREGRGAPPVTRVRADLDHCLFGPHSAGGANRPVSSRMADRVDLVHLGRLVQAPTHDTPHPPQNGRRMLTDCSSIRPRGTDVPESTIHEMASRRGEGGSMPQDMVFTP